MTTRWCSIEVDDQKRIVFPAPRPRQLPQALTSWGICFLASNCRHDSANIDLRYSTESGVGLTLLAPSPDAKPIVAFRQQWRVAWLRLDVGSDSRKGARGRQA